MPRTIYALLVGIDHYPPDVKPLHGCVNDIQRLLSFLSARVAAGGDAFEPLVLINGQATRQAVIDGFRRHLGRAGAEDVALFSYSGHGSQAPSPPEIWHLEPDHLDETLVCYDSRTPGGWDLADKELAQLIAEVAARGPHVSVVLDCCHSGTGTRGPAEADQPAVSVRRVPTDERQRPLASYLLSAQQAESFALVTGREAGIDSGWFRLPVGRHLLLSACRANEEAKELNLSGERRGVFSYYLLETLQQANASLSYRDLFKRVNALVRAGVAQQAPQIEATTLGDLDTAFLGGASARARMNEPTGAAYTVSYDREHGWVIDGGAVHGLPAPAGDETTWLALFPFHTDVSRLTSLGDAIGEARVTQVFPTQSAVAITLRNGAAADLGTTYKAVVTVLPLAPQLVSFEGDAAALDLVRDALTQAGPDGGPSLLVREADQSEAAYVLTAAPEGYRIRRTGDSFALVVDTPGHNESSALLAVQRLEHIARWRQTVALANPASRIPAGAVRLEILRPDAAGQWQVAEPASDLRLEYTFHNGKWQQPAFKIRLVNTSQRELYCMLLDLTATYGIFPLLPGGGAWLDPGAELWANFGEPFYAIVPEQLWAEGVMAFGDTLKLLVTTDECDATLLAQDDLPMTVQREIVLGGRHLEPTNTLDRLMDRVRSRHVSTRPADEERYADWISREVSFTTIRPLEAAEVGAPGATAALGHNVQIEGHSRLKARMRLTNLPEVGRDAGNLALPALLRDHPDAVEPFTFSASRAGEPGLSVIELLEVEDHTVVTPAEPLLVHIDQPLGTDDMLLPLGYDGEFYMPLGRIVRTDSGVDVRLDRLPAPTAGGTRDLKGSIKILFQKLVGQRLGWPYPHPLLALAMVGADGGVSYDADPAAIRAAVQGAERVLLYIHGIIGDTRGMAASARTAWLELAEPAPELAERYDLILTFDYENLHTTIEENARLLKQRLTEAGLGPQHGKTLDIVAHSMGGLVSRWLIEREDGNQMVHRLVMLGTPNAGSPWPAVEDYAIAALGIGLNALAKIAWPFRIVGLLVGALEKVDVTLDQMRPGSDFLATLAASDDPGAPYTVLAGTTTLHPQALATSGTQPSRIERLLARLLPKRLKHDITALAFFGQPNDMAVSVASMSSVPQARTPAPIVHEVASDHLMYFSTVSGLATLVEALER